MKNSACRDRNWRIAVQVLFLYTWVVNLQDAPGFVPVLPACALAGTACIWLRSRRPSYPSRGRQAAGILAGLGFSGITVLGNLALFDPVTSVLSLFNIGCALLGGFFLGYNTVVFLAECWKNGIPEGSRHGLAFLKAVLIWLWLLCLRGTDSRYGVYLFCAVAGVLCLCENAARRTPEKLRPSAVIFPVLFSGGVMLANYAIVSWQTGALLFAGGFCTAWEVLGWAGASLPREGASGDRNRGGLVFGLVFGTVAAVDLLYLLFALYPGVLTQDSFATVGQIMGQYAYNNTMPFWHTLTVQVFLKLGLAVFGDMNAAVAFFHGTQILFMAACFGAVAATLYQAGVPKWALLLVSGGYICLPYHIVYSVTMWKDVPFSGAAVLFLVGLYRQLKGIGRSKGLNYAALVIGALGFSLWRTNGWFAFLATVLAMLVLLGKKQKKLLFLLILVLVFCWVLINPVLDALGVGETELVEAFAVPMQQVARVVSMDRPLTQEETALLQEIFWLDGVKEKYLPYTVDPVKFDTFRRDRIGFLTENAGAYLRLYLTLGARYPADYLQAWVEETKGYWNGGYEFWIYTLNNGSQAYGITRQGGDNIVAGLFASAFRLMNEPEGMKLFSSIGLYVWGLIGCCVVNVWKKREEFLLTIPLLVLVIGLWLGSPVFCEFRYAYPVMIAMPMILCLTVWEKK